MSPFHNDILISLCKPHKLPFISVGDGKLQGMSDVRSERTGNPLPRLLLTRCSREGCRGCPSEHPREMSWEISSAAGVFQQHQPWLHGASLDKAKPGADPVALVLALLVAQGHPPISAWKAGEMSAITSCWP